jgi:hypothetical protein
MSLFSLAVVIAVWSFRQLELVAMGLGVIFVAGLSWRFRRNIWGAVCDAVAAAAIFAEMHVVATWQVSGGSPLDDVVGSILILMFGSLPYIAAAMVRVVPRYFSWNYFFTAILAISPLLALTATQQIARVYAAHNAAYGQGMVTYRGVVEVTDVASLPLGYQNDFFASSKGSAGASLSPALLIDFGNVKVACKTVRPFSAIRIDPVNQRCLAISKGTVVSAVEYMVN